MRSRFMGLAEKTAAVKNDPPVITVMSGSEGSGTLKGVVKQLLHGTNAKINVICGRNKSIRKKLRKAFIKEYHDRMNAMGFVERIQDVMCSSDILIMRASPNSVMEAVALNKPVILFGQLAGQELHNPDMICVSPFTARSRRNCPKRWRGCRRTAAKSCAKCGKHSAGMRRATLPQTPPRCSTSSSSPIGGKPESETKNRPTIKSRSVFCLCIFQSPSM